MCAMMKWALAALLAVQCACVTASGPPIFFAQKSTPPTSPAVHLRAPSHLQKRNDIDYQALQRTLVAHTIYKHANTAKPLTRRASSNDNLQGIGFLDGAYSIPINISSDPTQVVFVQLDTGSSDLWITSSSCASTQCNDNSVLKFDSSSSDTYRDITINGNPNFNISSSILGGNKSTTNSNLVSRQSDTAQVPFAIYYDDDTAASGHLGYDNISVGGFDVPQQIFALVNSTNVTLSSQGISGVLGLGFPRGSTISRSLIGYENQLEGAQPFPLVTSLLQISDEAYPMFGLYLSRTGGRATFGAVDSLVLPLATDRSQIEWYDVVPFPSGDTRLPANDTLNVDAQQLDSYVQWVLEMTGAGVGGQAATLRPTYSQVGAYPLALLDSATSSIVGPAAGVESIFNQITNARHVGGGRFVVPCDTTARMYFSFGGRNITLLPDDYIIGPNANQPYLCHAWPAAVQPDATGVDWILGTPFLRAVYSIYSIGVNGKESPKIGLYPLRQPADATASSVIFAPEPTANLSSFLQNQATTIANVLPNSLVSLTTASRAPYFFRNATTTLSAGAVPTTAGAPSTYVALLPTQLTMTSDLPVIASSASAVSAPSNPAIPSESNSAFSCSVSTLAQTTFTITSLLALLFLLL